MQQTACKPQNRKHMHVQAHLGGQSTCMYSPGRFRHVEPEPQAPTVLKGTRLLSISISEPPFAKLSRETDAPAQEAAHVSQYILCNCTNACMRFEQGNTTGSGSHIPAQTYSDTLGAYSGSSGSTGSGSGGGTSSFFPPFCTDQHIC